jgi:hypothetical protein
MANLQTGVVHTVFFWLKEKDNKEHQNLLYVGLQELAKIDLIKTAYVGRPADTNRGVIDSTYSFSVTFVFDNSVDQDAYQVHPDHYVFINNCSFLWEKVVVYDAES